MLVLVTYDISTETKEGRRRLNQVAKMCVKHGQRVQNSVFECLLEWNQFLILQDKLKKVINKEEDSLRFYNLGNDYSNRVIHIGRKPSIPLEGNLII